MASHAPKPQPNIENESTAQKIDDHIDNNGDFNLEVESLHQEFRKSLDLDCVTHDSILTELNERPNLHIESQKIAVDINKEIQVGGSSYEPYYSSVEFQDYKIVNENNERICCEDKENKKRGIEEIKTNQDEADHHNKISFDLNLSPPDQDGSSKSVGSSNFSTRLSQIISSNYHENLSLVTISSNRGGNRGDKDDDDLPSLIVMGCTRCLMYVMVPSVDGKCPKCNQFDSLLDIFRPHPPKKSRIY